MMHAYTAGMGATGWNGLMLALSLTHRRQQGDWSKRAVAHHHEIQG